VNFRRGFVDDGFERGVHQLGLKDEADGEHKYDPFLPRGRQHDGGDDDQRRHGGVRAHVALRVQRQPHAVCGVAQGVEEGRHFRLHILDFTLHIAHCTLHIEDRCC